MRITRKWLRGRHIAFTGDCGLPRADLIKAATKLGAKASSRGGIRRDTSLLVGGESLLWLHGSHGRKEAYARRLTVQGCRVWVIPATAFLALLRRGATPRLSRTGPRFFKESDVALFEGAPALALSPYAEQHLKLGRDPAKLASSLRTQGFPKWAREQAVVETALLHAMHVGGEDKRRCALCGSLTSPTLLEAVYIKAARHLTKREREDLTVIAMPLCILGCSSLYRRGLVGVNGDGRVLISRKLRSAGSDKLTRRLRTRKCEAFNERTASLFEWHLEWVFAL